MRPTLVAILLSACAASGQYPERMAPPPVPQRSGFDRDDVVGRVRRPRADNPALGFDGDDFLVGSTLTYAAAPSGQWWPAVAFDGANYLAVWSDLRGGLGFNIFGARVTPEGILLDSAAIPVTTSGGDQHKPDVAFGNNCYLVVWEDHYNDRICGARVTTDGVVIDTSYIVVGTGYWAENPSVAFDGTNFLVVWDDSRGSDGSGIFGARVSEGGVVLDPSSITVCRTGSRMWYPKVALNGANFLVAWQDCLDANDIYCARVTPEGISLDPNGIPVSTAPGTQAAPRLATDGTNCFVVWSDSRRGNEDPDIYGARVTADGIVLDSAGVVIWAWVPTQHNRVGDVAFDGANFLIVWSDQIDDTLYGIYGARVATSGAVLDTSRIVVGLGNWTWSPSLVSDGDNCLVLYKRNNDVCGGRVSPAGAVLDPDGFMVSLAANGQYGPAAAFDGTQFLVAWEECRGAPQDIFASRVSLSGVVLDSADIVLSNAAGDQRHVSVARGAECYFAVWQDGRDSADYDIYGARVAFDGTVLDPDGIAISTAAADEATPCALYDGENFLVVWSTGDIYGARVAQDGTVLDPDGFAIAVAPLLQYDPAIATDDTNLLVVWWDNRSRSYDIYAARVTAQGNVLDTAGITVSRASGDQGHPSAAFDGSNYLVAWTDYRLGAYSDVFAARITPQGAVLDPNGIAVVTNSSDQWLPSVAFDGTDFIVAWMDHADIYGTRVLPSGVVAEVFPMANQKWSQAAPALVQGVGSQLFLAYQGWAWAGYNNDRIWGKIGPFVGVEDTPTPGDPKAEARPTVIRGTLWLGPIVGHQPQTASCLLDLSGRKVLDLQPGANDVRHLSPGVYFIREGRGAGDMGQGQVRKVVVTR